MRAEFRSVVLVLLAVATTQACSTSSAQPPTTNPSSAAQEAAAAQDASSSTDSSSAANGSLGSLFGTSGGAATPSTIRSAQKTELQSEVDQLENELSVDIQNLSSLQSTLNSVQNKGIPTLASGSLAGSLVTGLGDFAAGAAGSALASSASSGGGSSSSTTGSGGSSYSPSASGDGSFTQSYGASSAYTAGIGAIGTGISSVIAEQQTATDVTAISGSVDQEIDQMNSEIKDLYAEIAQKNSQIDALNAQGTD